jgi:hypothetical protein
VGDVAVAAVAGLAACGFAAGRVVVGAALRACWAAMIVLSALICMPYRPEEPGKIFHYEGCKRLNGLAERYHLRHDGHGLDKNSSVK